MATEAELLAKLAKIDAELDDHDDPRISYKAGSRSVEHNERRRLLLMEREQVLKELNDLPSQAVSVYDDPNL